MIKLFSFFSLKLLVIPLIVVAIGGIYWYGSHVASLKSALEQSESIRRKEYHTNLLLSIKSEEVRQLELKNLDLQTELETLLASQPENPVCLPQDIVEHLNGILE